MVVHDSSPFDSGQYKPRHSQGRRSSSAADRRVESNARLTASTAVILFVLLAVEGLTILGGVRGNLKLHVFVGALLIPPVLLKMGSTGWRFVRYYSGSPAYKRKGPPPLVLRLLGPLVVVLTVILFASGVALVLSPNAVGGHLGFIHRASFVLWLGAMTIHVLGHIVETAKLAPLDLARRTRSQVEGASLRQWTVAASLVAGCLLGWALLGPTVHYINHTGFHFPGH